MAVNRKVGELSPLSSVYIFPLFHEDFVPNGYIDSLCCSGRAAILAVMGRILRYVFSITSIVLRVVLDSEESQLQMIANFNGTGKAKSSFFHSCLSVMSARFDFLVHFMTSKHHAHVGCQSARTCVNLSSCRVRNLEGHQCFQHVYSSHVDMLPTYRFSLRI